MYEKFACSVFPTKRKNIYIYIHLYLEISEDQMMGSNQCYVSS